MMSVKKIKKVKDTDLKAFIYADGIMIWGENMNFR
jgi:hypothetical protein